MSVVRLGITFLCSADSVDPSTLVGWSQFQYLRELLFAPEAVDRMEEMWLSMKKFDHGVDRSANASDFFVVTAVQLIVACFPYFRSKDMQCPNESVDMTLASICLDVLCFWMYRRDLGPCAAKHSTERIVPSNVVLFDDCCRCKWLEVQW